MDFGLIMASIMPVSYIIYRIYKIIRYPVVLTAEYVGSKDSPYTITSSDRFDNIRVPAKVSTPTFKYKYNGLVFYYRGFGFARSEPKKYIDGYTKKIRINPNKPNKAYMSNGLVMFVIILLSIFLGIIGLGLHFQ